MTHPALCKIEQIREQCDIRFQRRRGPGGQHRNKVETAVLLHHRPTGIRSEANERRSQSENLKMALHRLRVNLALEIRSVSIGENPSDTWKNRCVNGKLRVNPDHADLGCLLADALDALQAHSWNPAEAANWLGCSTSQLVKLLKTETRALELTNRHRAANGLHPLK